MKKRIIGLILAVMLVISLAAYAADRPAGEVYEPREDNTGYIGYDGKSWGYGYFNVGVIDTLTVGTSFTATVTRNVNLPLGAFTTNGEDIDAATAPGFELDDTIPGIVWADGETTPITITHPVPSDYSSGGAYRVICKDSDADATPIKIDFDVFVNSDGVAIDSSGTNQTAVAMASTAGSTPDVVTLTPATDFASLAAGQWITFRMWRDDVATGASDLEVFGIDFYYTATQ